MMGAPEVDSCLVMSFSIRFRSCAVVSSVVLHILLFLCFGSACGPFALLVIALTLVESTSKSWSSCTWKCLISILWLQVVISLFHLNTTIILQLQYYNYSYHII